MISKKQPEERAPIGADRKEADAAKLELRIRNLEETIKEVEEVMNAVGTDYEELNILFLKKEEPGKELDEVMEV